MLQGSWTWRNWESHCICECRFDGRDWACSSQSLPPPLQMLQWLHCLLILPICSLYQLLLRTIIIFVRIKPITEFNDEHTYLVALVIGSMLQFGVPAKIPKLSLNPLCMTSPVLDLTSRPLGSARRDGDHSRFMALMKVVAHQLIAWPTLEKAMLQVPSWVLNSYPMYTSNCVLYMLCKCSDSQISSEKINKIRC